MRVWTKIYRNNKIVGSHTAESLEQDQGLALLRCMEEICKKLDLAEPIWVSKHSRDLSVFRRTKLYPSDFMEPVSFDYCTVEIL